MKVSILQENLNKGINTASRFVASRAQLPVLNNLLLKTDRGRLKISATNLETGLNLWLGAKVEKEGAISIPAKILAEFVSSLPSAKVDFEVKENQLFLTCGSYRADFIGLPASEFPVIPSLSKQSATVFEGEFLSKAIGQVAFAAAVDEARPVLTGVLMSISETEVILVATDGYRLSLKKISLKENKKIKGLDKLKKFKKGLIVPARTLTEVARIVNDSEEGEVRLMVTPEANQMIFALGEAEIVSRLIEGEFPDYQKIVPDQSTTKLSLDKEDLLRAVRMASIFARESANIIRFKVDSSKLEVSANTAQVGSNFSNIEAKVTGKGGKIAFNSRYLLDFLNAAEADQVVFELSSALNPGLFTLPKDPSFLHIIMPVRVQE
jgi:DNA polymerase-3 subunit beta